MTAAGSMAEATIAMLFYKTPSDDRWQCFLFLKQTLKWERQLRHQRMLGFTINFAHLKSQLEFQLDTRALSIYNPHVFLHSIRTAAAFQEASDVHSLHATFYHVVVKK